MEHNKFIELVEKRAEEKMLKTGKLEGSHYAAMKEIQKELNESVPAETVVGQESVSSANGETAGHYPEPLTEEEKQACKLFGIQVEQYWAIINTSLENELVALFNNKKDADKYAEGLETFTVKPFAMQLKS